MTVDQFRAGAADRRARLAPVVGVALFAGLAIAGLAWAKWDPYAHKLTQLWGTRAWHGGSILDAAGQPASAPSWHGAWNFTVSYGKAVWMALAAALLISAAVEALLPRQAVVRLLSGRGRFGTVVGGLLAVPCMMCTCCSAPLAATLRRRGVPTGPVLGYWLGNPVLNPAVLVFLALVAPWQWVVTRALVGSLLVFGVTALVAGLAERRAGDDRDGVRAPDLAADLAGATRADAAEAEALELPEAFRLRSAPARFARALGRLSLTLVPEYFLVVVALGAFRGWLFPLGANAAHWGILAVILAAIAGTLMVIPTAGEIPILQGLAALGVGSGPVGALLITLPAISLPSMAMVGRALSWRVTAILAGAVMVTGLAGAVTLWALT